MSTTVTSVTDDVDLSIALGDCDTITRWLERERLQESFYEFVKAAWHVVEPSQTFTENWHIEVLCGVLQDIELRREPARRWVFNIPPGTLKSILISVLFNAWVWSRKPRKRFVCASYGATLSTRDNVRLRDLVQSSWYQSLWPEVQFAEDQDQKTRFNTAQGGWRIATSVDGPATGEHPDYFVIDDPLTAKGAESATERDTAWKWIQRTVSSRGVSRDVVLLLVMQRLHKDDPSGKLLEQGDCEHVCFPMRYVPTRPKTDEDAGYTADRRDPRTQAGELLIPQLISEEKVKKLELALGPYAAAGQLQQQPAPEGGGLFKRSWFNFLSARPKNVVRSARGWDTAGTEGDGDWTCGVRMDEFDNGKFLISNVQRDQLGPSGVDALMISTAATDGKDVAIREEKEGGSAGKAVIDARTKTLVGYDYAGVAVSGSKITRAKPFRAQVEAGNVYLLRTGDATQDAWIEVYLNELAQFPTGEHDDQVDASSCSFNAILLEPKKKSSWVAW